MPKITVYIVTKNRLQQLKKAIQSVEAQNYRDFELIVVDDGSNDGTAAYLKNYTSPFPFMFFRNEASSGAPAARNKAIFAANGELITGLDDDDRFLPDRLGEFMSTWSEERRVLAAEDYFVSGDRRFRWNKPPHVSFEDILFRNLIGNQVFTKTEYLRDLGGFDENLTASQDYDLWIRLLEKFGPAYIIRTPLQEVRVSNDPDRISNSKKRAFGYLACYLKHKSKMTYPQRKYHLYSIRRSQDKETGMLPVFGWVPAKYWIKELARIFRGT